MSAASQALDIPLKIKGRRVSLGLSQAQVARKAGVALSTIENAECRGYTGSVSTLVSIVAAMGGEMVILFPESGE